MDSKEKKRLYRQIMWDYNISPEDIESVFAGRQTHAGHYTRDMLFVKLLESYSWFTILQLFPGNEIQELLTSDTINKLRAKSLRKNYEFIQKRLHEVIPTSG